MMRFVLAFAVATSTSTSIACGSPQPATREEIGVHPEAEGVCMHQGQPLLLSKWPGGLCGKNPAQTPAGPVPECTELAAQLGCK